MTANAWIILISIIAFVIGAVGIVLSERRKKFLPKSNKGSEPGEGAHFMSSIYSSGRDGVYRTWTVPKDPQQYAKFFAKTKTGSKR